MKMQCSRCNAKAEYSPLRLGRLCGRCKWGRWIPRLRENHDAE
jgi:hypothetical protein